METQNKSRNGKSIHPVELGTREYSTGGQQKWGLQFQLSKFLLSTFACAFYFLFSALAFGQTAGGGVSSGPGGGTGGGGNSAYSTNSGTANLALSTSFGSTDLTNLNNRTWIYEKAACLGDGLSLGRYSWTNTIAKLRQGKTIRIELDGTGLSSFFFPGFIYNLTNQFPFAGFFNNCGIAPWGFNGVAQYGNAGVSQGKDGWWYTLYCYTTGIGGTNQARDYQLSYNTIMPWDVLILGYAVYTNGSSFKVQTNNNNGGAWGDFSGTINTLGVGTNAAVWRGTNSAGPKSFGWQWCSLSGGTNRILSYGIYNSTITNGFMLGVQGEASAVVSDEVAISTNITAPIYAAWSPDLILWQDIDLTNTLTTYLPTWASFYRTYVPNADVVLCDTYPAASDPTIPAQNNIIRTIAFQNGCSFFSSYGSFESTNVMSSRGLLYTGGNGDPHYPYAYPIYSYWLYRWLNLQNYYYSKSAGN
jgi:hypothetical protein